MTEHRRSYWPHVALAALAVLLALLLAPAVLQGSAPSAELAAAPVGLPPPIAGPAIGATFAWSADVPQTQALALSGRVYAGTTGVEPPGSTPLQGVVVTLYCSYNHFDKGNAIHSTTTDANGWYSLSADVARCEYFNIIESDPANYTSNGATSVGGTVKDPNWIEYVIPLTGKVLTGNKFWDKSRYTPTPSRTPSPRPSTATRTRTATHSLPTFTRTATRTPTRGPSPTATATRVPGGSADLEISKTLNAAQPVAPGSTITYTLKVTNLGPSLAPSVVVTDTQPGAWPWPMRCECQAQNCPGGDGPVPPDGDPTRILWNVGDVPQGATRTASVVCKVESWACGRIPNQASATSDVPDPISSNNGAQVTTEIGPCEGAPSVVLEKRLVSPANGQAYPGDTVTFTVIVSNVGTAPVYTYDLLDRYYVEGLEFISGSPAPDQSTVNQTVTGDWKGTLVWIGAPSLDAGQADVYTVTFRAKNACTIPMPAHCAIHCNEAVLYWAASPQDVATEVKASACVRVDERPQDLQVSKVLVSPPSGVANVGDTVRFRIDVMNAGPAPVTFDLEDTFLEAEFDFLGATPPPTVQTSDGTWHFLLWDNLTLPPGGTFTVLVDLKAKMPASTARNCAHYIPSQTTPGATAATGPLSCASVQVRPLEGRHFTVTKKFTVPSNHVAKLGDWVAFQTQWTNVGTDPATEVRLHDYVSPPTVSAFFPLNMGFIMPFATGDWAEVVASFMTQDTGSPAVNTAEWTATWPDGTKETKSASDYVYITDGAAGKGLFISKQLISPQGGAVVSDTVRFRITITNVTGADLPTLGLSDTFDQQCLAFDGASLPPTSVGPGSLAWANVGPLPLGATRIVEVGFHAHGVCPSANNCAATHYQAANGQVMYSVDCETLPIRGPQPRITVVKHRVSPSPAPVGSVVIWEIEVRNQGDAPLATVPLHDGYQSAHFDFDSATPAPDATDLANGRLDWNDIGPLAPGQARFVVLRLRAKKPGLGVRNCAEVHYSVGSSSQVPYDCSKLDIIAPDPSISVQKERVAQDPSRPVAVGDTVTFRVTVRNTGPAPLADVVVLDHYDADCLTFVAAPGMATVFAPGLLRWDFPGPGALNPGDSLSWDVVFQVKSPCNPIPNCATADGKGPAGEPVHDETCVEFPVALPEPGLIVHKRLAGPEELPGLGTVMRFEVVVQNSGNMVLQTVPVDEPFDSDCLEYVTTSPSPDAVAPGLVHWNNVGPLAPGDSKVLSVFLRAKAHCRMTWNCSRAFWVVEGEVRLDAMDCAEVPIGPPRFRVYLPIVMKSWLAPGPTPTATLTRAPSATRTATAPSAPSPTTTAFARTATPTYTTPAPSATSPPASPTATGTSAAATGTASATPGGPSATPGVATATPTATAQGTMLFSDDFASDQLSGWTSNGGTWTNPGGYMRGVSSGSMAVWNMRSITATNSVYEATVTVESGRQAGLVFRSSADGTSSYALILDMTTNEFFLASGSPYQNLGGVIFHSPLEFGHPYSMKVIVSGETLEAYLDGSKRVALTDSAYSTGYFGLMLLSAEATFDDVEAWALP